jgi:lysozyme
MKYPKWLFATSILSGAILIGAVGFSDLGRAQSPAPTESSWTELTDDASRQSLFQDNIIPAKLAEDVARGTEGTTNLAIPKDFMFPDDAKFDRILNKDRESSIFGIDISHYTGKNIKFENMRLQRILFVYAKATQGVAYNDALFSTYWSKLEALPPSQKVYRGAYHFLTAADPGRAQAGRFVDYVELHGGFKPDDMPPCLDLEWDRTTTNPDRWKGQTPDEILAKALEWLKEVERRTNRKPMVYTALSWWHDRGIPVAKIELFKDYPIWIADYSKSHKASEKPSIISDRSQDLWQFAEDAKLTTGYPGGSVDANIYYGSLEKFKKDFNLPQ